MKFTESLPTDKVPSQRELFAAVARGQIGYIEGPADNQTKYGRFTGANFLPWCGSFVMWCADKVKLRIPNCVYTQGGANAFMKSGRWQNAEVATPEVGDIAFFDFPGDNINRISHIGIVVKVFKNGQIETIEGNTAPTKAGDQRNGGEVCVKIRAYKKRNGTVRRLPVYIVGFGKPKFKGD
jgi:hypothetical protein